MNKILMRIALVFAIMLSACSKENTTSDENVVTNTSPIADAGVNQSTATNKPVTLDASKSSDTDQDSLTYKWSISTKPDTSNPTLLDSTTLNPVFTPDIDGTYSISLIVNDGTIDSNVDSITIIATNSIPLADAGSDKSIATDELVTLDASKSSDENGDILSYKWAITSQPTLSNPSLLNTSIISPTFTTDKDGEYIISLVVNDGKVDSIADSLSIIVTRTLTGTLPIFTSESNVSVNENQLDVTQVTTVNEAVFSLSGEESTFFTIDTNSGVITFKNAPDYETKQEYTIVVNAVDEDMNASQNLTVYINDINENIVSLCDVRNLTFDTLVNTTDILRAWVEGEDGLLNNTTVKWNSVLDADHYEFYLKFPSGWEPGYINIYNGLNMRFDYDSSVSGYGFTVSGNDVILTSNEFVDGAVLEITLKALDANGDTISVSAPLSFLIAREYISDTTSSLLSDAEDSAVSLEWCQVDNADKYSLMYGSVESNLDEIINDISLNVLSKKVSSLVNDNNYYFSLAAVNENGNGKFSDPIKVTPTAMQSNLDFSIDKVVFNQSVQVDLENNLNATPIIANKPGVLRVFINADKNNENKKVTIELGGSNNGVALESIIKEVALSDTTFDTSDSSNNVVFFDINDTKWMQADTSFYINIDPFNAINETDETNNRYPSVDEKSFGFEDRYKMRVNLVPVRSTQGSVSISNSLTNGLKEYLQALYPLSEVEITIDSELDLSSMTAKENGEGWDTILGELNDYKDIAVSSDTTKADVFYYGFIDREGDSQSGLAGLAYINSIENFAQGGFEPSLVGIGRIDTNDLQSLYETLAHEIGHNHGREHVDNSNETNDLCGVPGNVDTSYPYNSSGSAYGRISKTGYNSTQNYLLEKSLYHDIMSYCSRSWISDYTYKGISDFQKELDTLYSRSSTVNARSLTLSQTKIAGKMIRGEVTVDKENTTSYTLKKAYEILWSANSSQANSRYYALVTMKNKEEYKIPFIVESLDHTSIKHFKFFIPSSQEVDSMKIEDTQLSMVYNLD